MKNRHHTEEWKQKMREINLKNPVKYWLGRKMPEEIRKKISEGNKGKLTGDKNPAKRPEEREKHRLLRLKQKLPTKDTIIEMKVQEGIKLTGRNFETHKPIENFVMADIFMEPNIIIFCDGCYWHGCPKCFPDRVKLDPIQKRNIERDSLVNKFFNDTGKYRVLRFWEHDIKQNFKDKVLDRIHNLKLGI